MKVRLFTLLFFLSIAAKAQIITHFAGNDTFGYSGDGGLAISAELANPNRARPDGDGNVYIADNANGRIRKVSVDGIITTIAGGISLAYDSGDGSPATAAGIGAPTSVAIDTAGNIYISTANHDAIAGPWIRKIDSDGIITTISGGVYGYSGDGGPATAAGYLSISDITVDHAGNIYISDWENNRIRKINTAGIITTIAGNGTIGYSGDGGPADSAQLSEPGGVAVDNFGNVYISDNLNNRIRKVSTAGIITTIAGNGTPGYSGDESAATAAELWSPAGIAVDNAGNIYIADNENFRVRRVNTAGIITTVVGNGTSSDSGNGSLATAAELSSPVGVSVDIAGNIYIADNNNVRKVSSISTELTATVIPKLGVFIYPNPANNLLNISWQDISQPEIQISIINMEGQQLYTTTVASAVKHTTLPVAMLPDGVYVCVLQSGEGRYYGKFTVVR